jgi:hypothetical protein
MSMIRGSQKVCPASAGFVCNALVRPVKPRWHIVIEGGNSLAGYAKRFEAASITGIGRGGLDAKAVLAWVAVGIPLCWGIWKTLESAAKIFL